MNPLLFGIYFAWIYNPIIASLIFIPTFIFVIRYNLHMFQLNGYKSKTHFHWMKNNIGKQWPLYVGVILTVIGVVRTFLFIGYVALAIIEDIWLLVIMIAYIRYKRLPAKKKLVYTPRVKRLIATDIILLIILLCIQFKLFGLGFWTELLLLYISLQFLIVMLANLINKPIEKAVNNGYIRDAKRILESQSNMTVIGVTGSYGKTSVKFFLNTLLKEHFNVLMTPESYNTPMGVVRTIRENMRATDEIFICEMGARHVGDVKEICDIVAPKHGIITSIGPQHLETFGNIDAIKNTKFELADAVAGKGILFLNGDNEYIVEKSSEYDNKVYYHAKEETNGYYAKDVSLSNHGTEFTVVSPDGEQETFSMKLIGEHNIINVVGAIAVANTLGVSLSDLRIAVRRLEPVPHRLQLIEKGNVVIIDDAFNSNPVGSKAAVEILGQFEGTRILITPGMVELGSKEEHYNKKFGEYAAKCCDYILLVGINRTKPIMDGALSAGFSEEKILAYDSLGEALEKAYGIPTEDKKYILLENDLPDNY